MIQYHNYRKRCEITLAGWDEVSIYHIQIDQTVLVTENKLDGQDAPNDDHQSALSVK